MKDLVDDPFVLSLLNANPYSSVAVIPHHENKNQSKRSGSVPSPVPPNVLRAIPVQFSLPRNHTPQLQPQPRPPSANNPVSPRFVFMSGDMVLFADQTFRAGLKKRMVKSLLIFTTRFGNSRPARSRPSSHRMVHQTLIDLFQKVMHYDAPLHAHPLRNTLCPYPNSRGWVCDICQQCFPEGIASNHCQE